MKSVDFVTPGLEESSPIPSSSRIMGMRQRRCSYRPGEQDGDPHTQPPASHEDTDDPVLLTVHSRVALLGSILVQGQGMDGTDLTRSMLREHLRRQRGEGATVREQASTLYYLMMSRASQHYMEQFPDYMEDLGLEVDVDASARCLPGPTPFYQWVEEEMWQQFVDFFEAMSGFETEEVQRNRGSPTMPSQELQSWRRWAGMEVPTENRGRSRSPRGTTRTRYPGSAQATQGNGVTGEDAGDSTSLTHNYWGDRGTGSGERRRRTRRRNRPDRDRSREHRGAGQSNREQRVRARVTRETRTLGPRECADWSRGANDTRTPGATGSTPSTSTRGAAPSGAGGELDIIQATGQWMAITGLRQPGDEQLEPANALTKQAQNSAKTALRRLSERDLQTMVQGLMRLMGMMYIELARIIITTQDERRRRDDEEVEIEVEEEEEDEESIYMQKYMDVKAGHRWGNLLQDLVNLGEDPTSITLLKGLLRRIGTSLYLQTPRGAQLQAALVAATTGHTDSVPEVCETEDNEVERMETWWARLKDHMDLGSEEGRGRSSHDLPSSAPEHQLEHSDQQVQQWEDERQKLEKEKEEEEAEQRKHEEEETAERLADENRIAEYEAGQFRDWEQWVVLNTPTVPKRRRLVVTSPADGDRTGQQVTASVTLPKASKMDQLSFTVRVENQPDMPSQEPSNRPGRMELPVDMNGPMYQRTYEAWKAGEITNDGVERIFGSDILFLYQVTSEGIPGDTLPAASTTSSLGALATATGLEQTQLDLSNTEDGGQWGHELRVGEQVLDLNDTEDSAGK